MKNKDEQKNPIYIISIDASNLEHVSVSTDDNVNAAAKEVYTLKMPKIKTFADFARIYKGTMNNTLDLEHLRTICKETEKTITLNSRKKTEVKKVYSDIFVDLTFKKPIREVEEEDTYYVNTNNHGVNITCKDKKLGKIAKDNDNNNYNPERLRTDLYVNGFDIVEINDKGKVTHRTHYVHYKRSSSKSRNGSCLFIQEKYYDEMIKWSHLGLSIPDIENTKIDLASLKAYESLVCSEIESIIKIDPRCILIVDDLKSPEFEAYQSVTYQEKSDIEVEYTAKNGKKKSRQKTISEIKCKNQWRTLSNKCSDGESLLDVSVFKEHNLEQYGFLLLRQGFFKSAALNTNIVDFYKDQFKEQYNTATIYDIFGREKRVSDIRMIICPSSLKILKFAELFFQNKCNNEKMSQQKCFDHWCNHVQKDNNVFGVVKHEKSSPFGKNINQLSYQMINTFPLDLSAEAKEDMLLKLMKEDFRYVQRLKDDDDFFKQHISIKNDDDNDFEDDESEKNNNDSDILGARAFIIAMLKKHPDFIKTDLYSDFKHDIIENYRKNMRTGKIKTQGDYCVQFGNVWELLLSTVRKITSNDVLHKGRQCYCPAYHDLEELAIFRSPHICTGNIMFATNTYHKQFKKYFNLTYNIVIVNSWDNDWLDRSQGSDFDSDSLLLVSNKYITDIAEQCDIIVKRGEENKCIYTTPVNEIKGDNQPRLYNLSNMAEIDHCIARNNIGKVVNTSQLLNSYYWDIRAKKNKANEYLLKKLYDNISICSSLSQVEIDKAKKLFRNLDVGKILNNCETIYSEDGDFIFSVKKEKVKIPKKQFSENELKTIQAEFKKMEHQNDYNEPKILQMLESIDKILINQDQNVKINSQFLSLIPEELKYKKFKRNEEETDYLLKKVKPDFFQHCSKDSDCVFESFVCPMDDLEVLLSEKFPRKSKCCRIGRGKKISVLDLLVKDKQKVNYDQLTKIYNIVHDYKQNINAIYVDAKRDDSEETKQKRKNVVDIVRLEKVKTLQSMVIRKSTILYLYCIIFDPNFPDKKKKYEYRKIKLVILSLLYEAQPELMESVFDVNHSDKNAII